MSDKLSQTDNEMAVYIYSKKLAAEEVIKQADRDIATNEHVREEVLDQRASAVVGRTIINAAAKDHYTRHQAEYVEQARQEAEADGIHINLGLDKQ